MYLLEPWFEPATLFQIEKKTATRDVYSLAYISVLLNWDTLDLNNWSPGIILYMAAGGRPAMLALPAKAACWMHRAYTNTLDLIESRPLLERTPLVGSLWGLCHYGPLYHHTTDSPAGVSLTFLLVTMDGIT
ncbi:hypothetical protein KUCAC02_027232, partial [Chaenocephalus aceratus]